MQTHRLKLFYVIFVILALALASCTSSHFYTPNTVNLPTLSQRGDVILSGAIFIGESQSGWEAQAAYSPIKHVGLIANHIRLHYRGDTPLDEFPMPPISSRVEFAGQLRLTELGAGFYQQAGKNQEYLLSLFGCVGKAQANTTYRPFSAPLRETQWKFHRYTLQPGIRLHHQQLRFGTAFRLSLVQFTTGRIDARIPVQELKRIELLKDHSPMLFLEVLWTMGYYLRPVLVSINTTGVALGNPSLNALGLASNHVSLMASLNLHDLRKKIEKK
ncbi:MAG: hypothetical protein NZM43_11895 [Saprospiraceae bacterium]|nr:hypothetical protein [Saprospiraceae bacterium]MDW8485012.1 hypothetical protein [Saprospiraceae bacterium]